MALRSQKKDLQFYEDIAPTFAGKKYEIPPPNICPSCRYQKRLVLRNERKLYVRKCDLTDKEVVSIYHPENEYKAYAQDEWWKDTWDVMEYGREFDFSRPFFKQFLEMKRQVPRPALTNHRSVNSEYTNQSQDNKNSYMLTSSNHCEDCLYGHWVQDACKDNVDCLLVERSELCYECVNIMECYNSRYLQSCSNCSDCFFCYDCKGCDSCIGCCGLQNKKYHIFNEPVSKEEFEVYRDENFKNRTDVEKVRSEFLEKLQQFQHKFYFGFNNENSSGDYIQNTKNAFSCFNCRHVEDISHCQDSWREKMCMDMTETCDDVACYEQHGSACNNNCLFVSQVWDCHDMLYCDLCFSSNNCFGCVGLNHKEYCIFNKQYDKEEYDQLVAKMIGHMRETGEWGEFFPRNLSTFGYNESVAQEYFPLTKDQALSQGYFWSDYEAPQPAVEKVIEASQLPENIEDIPDDILNWAIKCEVTQKPFRIIKQELDFYRKQNIPIPRKHPDQRHQERMELRNPRKLWDRTCDKCGKGIQSTYNSDRKETVYCGECYLKETY